MESIQQSKQQTQEDVLPNGHVFQGGYALEILLSNDSAFGDVYRVT
jgi:hypothetical protein